jgi:hypothetical protein
MTLVGLLPVFHTLNIIIDFLLFLFLLLLSIQSLVYDEPEPIDFFLNNLSLTDLVLCCPKQKSYCH